MNILLVNDDGIDTQRLAMTETVLSEFGRVYVVAPNKQQSGKSIAITIGGFDFEKIDDTHYAIQGTPADCVLFGKYGLNLDIDVVFSGVNGGYNLGVDTMYSGTVGAAFQAKYHLLPSVALSADGVGSEVLENDLRSTLTHIVKNKLYSKEFVLNVNFPKERFVASKGILNTKTYFLSYSLNASIDKNRFNINREIINESIPNDSDIFAITNGYISISRLKNDIPVEE